ncbi:putative ATP-binding protein involved in virulence [Promicromonospora sp. AC04]|uniref:AAA family ATPase n=1 Tax=Promicromonospora sp. AC04 TaxID=2135723 RepID=UPI000D368D11|nr:AAA family ATPase [Promicromonospora sp. AC04]PUB31951.1 putative ATP-binding protein involved in virulence [Promicromonospora sp. AC04]
MGTKDGVIDLDPERPTVLTGANGSGKSTILRLTAALSQLRVNELRQAPVREFRLEFEGGADLVLLTRRGSDTRTVTWGDSHYRFSSDADGDIPTWALDILDESGGSIQVAADEILEAGLQMGIDRDEIMRARNALIHGNPKSITNKQPEWASNLLSRIKVLFVSDQRIISTESTAEASQYQRYASARQARTSTRFAVDAASRNIADRIRRASSEYGSHSQRLDRELPERLITAMTRRRDIERATLERLLEITENRRLALSQVGLLDDRRSLPLNVSAEALEDSNTRRVVHAVLESNMEKFAVLDNLETRLSTFKEFLDERFYPKILTIDRRSGFRFELPGAQIVTPRQLSSGEQQMTVLAYEILFKTDRETLVLVDEPEISLHVLWQDTLLRDLTKLGRPSGARFLLATHSPAILAGSPDLERSLDEAVDAEW